MITKRAFLSKSVAAGLSLVPPVSAMTGSRAHAANYPAGPVKIIVAQAAGGSLDVLLRVSAEHLSRAWGKQVVVLNLPAGGVGVIAARAAAAAPSDGYTRSWRASRSSRSSQKSRQTSLLMSMISFRLP